MKSKDLAALWSRPDNSRLAPKQVSIRLPVHVMARLRALEELYPTRTRTEIIGDLLSAALDEVTKGMPTYKGEFWGEAEDGVRLFRVVGPALKYRELANKHFTDIEKELGNKNPPLLFDRDLLEEEGNFDS